LIELLLVLALLAMAVAVAAPSLSRFFRGRALDSEARRMLALTHYAQSRAVAEGVPMILWFRPDDNTYGLEAEITYSGVDTRAVTNQVDSKLEIELAESMSERALPWKVSTEIAGARPAIRFTPDGYVGETSPYWVWIKSADEAETEAVWLVLDDNHLNYELQSLQPVIPR
jgi:Tfp pilus assembly protein FimT